MKRPFMFYLCPQWNILTDSTVNNSWVFFRTALTMYRVNHNLEENDEFATRNRKSSLVKYSFDRDDCDVDKWIEQKKLNEKCNFFNIFLIDVLSWNDLLIQCMYYWCKTSIFVTLYENTLRIYNIKFYLDKIKKKVLM